MKKLKMIYELAPVPIFITLVIGLMAILYTDFYSYPNFSDPVPNIFAGMVGMGFLWIGAEASKKGGMVERFKAGGCTGLVIGIVYAILWEIMRLTQQGEPEFMRTQPVSFDLVSFLVTLVIMTVLLLILGGILALVGGGLNKTLEKKNAAA